MPGPNIDLQRLMQKLWFCQGTVSLLAHLREILDIDAVFEMFVDRSLFRDSSTAVVASICAGIVMAAENARVVRQ